MDENINCNATTFAVKWAFLPLSMTLVHNQKLICISSTFFLLSFHFLSCALL